MVRQLISAPPDYPRAYICDECIGVCNAILEDDRTTFISPEHMPATFTVLGLNEERFLSLCERYPDSRIEYTSEGTVILTPPNDPETSVKVAEVTGQLFDWAKTKGTGHVTGPDGLFLFRDRSRRSPTATWFDAQRWQAAQIPGTRFPTFAPDFVIEVRSPGQPAKPLQEKMEEYLENGVTLAWLIDFSDHSVAIYRKNQSTEVLTNPAKVEGDGPVEGFQLDLENIF
jgi:Uma2 family endonuclease